MGRRALLLGIVLAAVAAGPGAPAASDTPFDVNSALDDGDVAIGNGLCATGGGVCTLRAAIQEANSTVGPEEILIKIPPLNSPTTIQPATALPVVTSQTTIDGTTQYSSPHSPAVRLLGSSA